MRSKEYYIDNGIELICDQRVDDIDLNKKQICLSNNRDIIFDKLVFATGAKLKKLDNLDKTIDVHYLRSLNESLILRQSMEKDRKIIIIGGGFIGLEIAAVCAERGLEVCVIEQESRLMKHAVPDDVSEFYKDYHAARGVNIFTNSIIKNIEKLKTIIIYN